MFTGKFTNGYIENQKNVDAIAPNVRRYVALAQSRGGACFCTRGAKQGYDVICLFSRWQKPWHQGECPAGAGPAGWFLPGGFSR